jgi:hypothetical protein
MEAGRNISAYNRGMKGYRTPNIDHIANEGANFTDYYGQQSRTAGARVHRRSESRCALGPCKIGLPGGREGLSDKDPRLAGLPVPRGCGWL